MKVPLVVSCPGRFTAGRRVREVVGLVDLAPTLTSLAASRALPDAAGSSLMPLLEGRKTAWRDEAFSEFYAVLGLPPTRMNRSGKWKLVHYDGYRPQLFDLEADPHEFSDLGESAAHAAIRDDLHKRVLAGWSGEAMEREIASRRRRQILRRWAEKVRPATPHQWRPPAVADRILE